VVDELDSLDPAVAEGLYRLTQEALNNTLKHAAATSVEIRLKVEGEELILEVADNGQGFDPVHARGQGGLGLTTMRDRAETLGGAFNLISTPGEGTLVKVSLPLNAAFSL
jgi:signal transduction histidine kinase